MEKTTNSSPAGIEPFGYFKVESFGWTDCAETDEGAVALYDQSAIDKLLVEYRHEILREVRKELASKKGGAA